MVIRIQRISILINFPSVIVAITVAVGVVGIGGVGVNLLTID